MSQPVTREDLFSLMNSYEERLRRLETALATLTATPGAGTVTIAMMASAANGGPGAEAFFAQLGVGSLARARGNGIVFDNEIWDTSGRYNPATGIFTSGRAGIYFFRWQLRASVASGDWYQSRIHFSGTYSLDYGGNVCWGPHTDTHGSIVTRMAVGDTAAIDFMSPAATTFNIVRDNPDGGTYGTYFCGHFVGPL